MLKNPRIITTQLNHPKPCTWLIYLRMAWHVPLSGKTERPKHAAPNSNKPFSKVRYNPCPSDGWVNHWIILVDPVDGGVFLAQIAHVVVCSGTKKKVRLSFGNNGWHNTTAITRKQKITHVFRSGVPGCPAE